MHLEVIQKAIPTKEEEKEVLKQAKAMIKHLETALPQTKVSLGGSVAKGTWLREGIDVDIFVAFPLSLRGENISDVLAKHVDMERVHGSRDYFRKEGKITFEVIPILAIKKAEQAENITDVSPLHSKWVKANSTQEVRDEIRFAKLFFQANKLYGAESYIQGFSGYVIEVLTIHYGSFQKLIKAMSKWEKPVIDHAKHHKDVFFEVNDSKLVSPIIVIDPVQPGRNASAAVGEEKFRKAIEVAKKYLKSPSPEFFVKKPLSVKIGILIHASPLDDKIDVAGCKLLKVFNFIARELTRAGFKIKQKEWDLDGKAVLAFELDSLTLLPETVITGPPIDMKEHVLAFKKKYKSTKVVDGKITAKIKRKYVDATKLVSDLIKSPYVQEKVARISL